MSGHIELVSEDTPNKQMGIPSEKVKNHFESIIHPGSRIRHIALYIAMLHDGDYINVRYFNDKHDFTLRGSSKLNTSSILICMRLGENAVNHLQEMYPGYTVNFVDAQTASICFDDFDRQNLPYPEFIASYELVPM